jgi:hypothetical protein
MIFSVVRLTRYQAGGRDVDNLTTKAYRLSLSGVVSLHHPAHRGNHGRKKITLYGVKSALEGYQALPALYRKTGE